MLRNFILALPVLLVSFHSNARAANPWHELAKSEDRFVQLEKTLINCVYPSLISSEVKNKDIQRKFNPPSKEVCDSVMSRFSELQTSIHDLDLKFPIYSELILSQKTQGDLNAAGLGTGLQSPNKRKLLSQFQVDPWKIEHQIRNQLGVNNTKTTESPYCRLTSGEKSLVFENRHDQNFWHAFLFENGYDCTAQALKEASHRSNNQNGLGTADSTFQQKLMIKDIKSKMISEKILDRHLILYFPQLGYNFPNKPGDKPRELLQPKSMEKWFSQMGAQFVLIGRNPVGPIDEQVAVSAAKVASVLKQNPKSTVIIIGRSMGGFIAREVLQKNPEISKRVSMTLLVGATPYGSVIGDYKGRADVHDGTYLLTKDLMTVLFSGVLGIFQPHIPDLMRNSSIRNNIDSMTYRPWTREIIEANERSDQDKVLNVITLRPSTQNYFNGSDRVAGVDLTFMLMSMHGPTEGSAPFAQVSWDTQASARVFFEKYNHLGFWAMPEPEAFDLFLSSLWTAKEMGMF